jgi:hypothetical protein
MILKKAITMKKKKNSHIKKNQWTLQTLYFGMQSINIRIFKIYFLKNHIYYLISFNIQEF